MAEEKGSPCPITVPPDQFMHHLHGLVSTCERALVNTPSIEYKDSESEKDRVSCLKAWKTVFEDSEYQHVPKHKMSLCDLVFVAYCYQHCRRYVVARQWGRGVMSCSIDERFTLLRGFHGLIRCFIHETPYHARDLLDQMPNLWHRICGLITYGIQQTHTRAQRERDLLMLANSSELLETPLKPMLLDLHDMGHATRISTMEAITRAEEANKLLQLEKQQDLTNIVSLSDNWQDQMNAITDFHDPRVPSNRSNSRLYMPETFDIFSLVADSSRLCYWTSLLRQFLSRHHGRIRPAHEVPHVSAFSTSNLYETLRKRSTMVIVKDTELEVQQLYLCFHTPIGARDHAMRVNTGSKGAQNMGSVMAVELGSKAYQYFMERLVDSPSKIFFMAREEAVKQEAYEAWVWTLWDRLRQQNGMRWNRDWFIQPDDLVTRLNDNECSYTNLRMPFPTRKHVRRPMVVRFGGHYYIQAVVPDFPTQPRDDLSDWNETKVGEAFELWETKDPLEAIACWCSLVCTRFDGKLSDRNDIGPWLDTLVFDPVLVDPTKIKVNEEERQRQILAAVWDD